MNEVDMPPPDDGESAYIQAAIRDPAAFEWLYNRHHDRIFRYVYSKVRETGTAADLTSDVFLKALIHLRRYTDRGVPFSAWLFRIATNEVNLYFRKSGRERAVSIHPEAREEWENQWDGAALRDSLAEALEALPPEDFQLIEWRFFDGLRFREIADIEATTEAAVKMKVYRILETIKKQLLQRG